MYKLTEIFIQNLYRHIITSIKKPVFFGWLANFRRNIFLIKTNTRCFDNIVSVVKLDALSWSRRNFKQHGAWVSPRSAWVRG